MILKTIAGMAGLVLFCSTAVAQVQNGTNGVAPTVPPPSQPMGDSNNGTHQTRMVPGSTDLLSGNGATFGQGGQAGQESNGGQGSNAPPPPASTAPPPAGNRGFAPR